RPGSDRGELRHVRAAGAQRLPRHRRRRGRPLRATPAPVRRARPRAPGRGRPGRGGGRGHAPPRRSLPRLPRGDRGGEAHQPDLEAGALRRRRQRLERRLLAVRRRCRRGAPRGRGASMKVQLLGQSLRLRLDEDELAALLAGAVVANETALAGAALRQTLRLGPGGPAVEAAPGDWAFTLPEAEVRAYAARLPSREGLAFRLGEGGAALALAFEVDVRARVRRRGPPARGGRAGGGGGA